MPRGPESAGQRSGDLGAAGVTAGVHDPVAAVPALAGQRRVPVSGKVEAGAELLQQRDGGRSLLDEGADGVLVAQSRAGHERVVDVQLDVVVAAEDGGQAALGPGGAAVAEGRLGDDGDGTAGVGQGDRGHQPGGAGAHDDHVRVARPCGSGERQRGHDGAVRLGRGARAHPEQPHSATGEGVPSAIMASTAERARAAISGSTVTSSRPSRSARSSFSGVDIFM
jgi:hypothetical protein